MEPERKAPTLVDLCTRTVIDNLRYLGSVEGIDLHLLKNILPHCTLDQLAHIENSTKGMDLTPVTDKLWKGFYKLKFGEESVSREIEKMKQKKVRYKWKYLYEQEIERRKEAEVMVANKLRKRYAEDLAKKQSKQIKICSKIPPSSKRSFFGGSGCSNVSNYKNPLLKKAKIEANSRARMLATSRNSSLVRPSQPTKPSHVHRPSVTSQFKQTGLRR